MILYFLYKNKKIIIQTLLNIDYYINRVNILIIIKKNIIFINFNQKN